MYKRPYYVYVVEGSDGKFYTGMTKSIRRRLNEHNGVGYWRNPKSWTAKRRPVFLVHLEKHPDKVTAAAREHEIKDLSHDEKIKLIATTTKDQILSAI